MIKFVLTTSFLLFAQNTFAQSYFQVLQTNFQDAKDVITYTDFERPGTPKARICTEVSEKTPYKETFVRVDKFTQNKEGQGPLLPPSSVTKIIYRAYSNNVFSEGVFDSATTTMNAGRTEIETKLVDSENNLTWTLQVRKAGDILIFSRAERVPGNKEEDVPDSIQQFYGYCFHQPETEQ